MFIMSTTIQIPMNEETRISLEDCFVDVPNMDARKFIFDAIKQACQDAKRSQRNKVTPTNQRQEDGQMKQVEYSLKDVDFGKYILDSNLAWLPKNITPEENTPIELKLGDRAMKYIHAFGSLTLIRHEQFNIAEDKFVAQTLEQMKASNAPADNITQWQKSQEAIKVERLAVIPACIEEAIYIAIWPLIIQKVDANDSKMFDEEFEEVYKEKEATPASSLDAAPPTAEPKDV